MNKFLSFFLAALFLTGTGFVFSREQNGDIDSSEIVTILEEINEKLEKMQPRKELRDDWKAPDKGFGGTMYFPVRINFDIQKMNDYVAGLGSYDPFPIVFIPLVDSGGGTWRISFSKYFQIGINYWGGGFSHLGQQNHQTDTNLANITIDENGDGLDDYYTYASYGYFYWSFLGMGKLPVAKILNLVLGGQIGLGSESFGIDRNERTAFPLAGLGISSGSSDWERRFMVAGGWLGVQLNLDKRNIVKLGLDVGFDYFVPFYNWKPSPGIHVQESSPPNDFNAMNLWISVGPQFHFYYLMRFSREACQPPHFL